MAYSKRIPPNKILLNVEDFNKLIEALTNLSECDNENVSKKSSKMKDKLLRYSVPIISENEETSVDMRFYNNEMVDLFHILFYGISDIVSTETNYFDVLVRVREKIKEERMTNE